jgi:hypothetical protein
MAEPRDDKLAIVQRQADDVTHQMRHNLEQAQEREGGCGARCVAPPANTTLNRVLRAGFQVDW